MNLAITFTPNGIGQCLYTEAIDLASLGSLRIERASNIEFDNKKQVWRVLDLGGKPLHEAKSRQACLDWEQEYFNKDNQHGHGIAKNYHSPDSRSI